MTKVISVIHYESLDQAVRNANIAFEAGVLAVFLIHMEGEDEMLLPVAVKIKETWPDKLISIYARVHFPQS